MMFDWLIDDDDDYDDDDMNSTSSPLSLIVFKYSK